MRRRSWALVLFAGLALASSALAQQSRAPGSLRVIRMTIEGPISEAEVQSAVGPNGLGELLRSCATAHDADVDHEPSHVRLEVGAGGAVTTVSIDETASRGERGQALEDCIARSLRALTLPARAEATHVGIELCWQVRLEPSDTRGGLGLRSPPECVPTPRSTRLMDAVLPATTMPYPTVSVTVARGRVSVHPTRAIAVRSVEGLFDRHIAELAPCFQIALPRELPRRSSATITVSVRTIGTGAFVQTTTSFSGTPDVGECISREVGGWSFPPPTGGGATVEITVTATHDGHVF